MPLDRQARADQIGRIIAAAGEPFTYAGLEGPFYATVAPYKPAATDADRNLALIGNSVVLKAARAVFGDKLPRQGQYFTDGAGNILRIQAVPPQVKTLPTIEFICGNTVAGQGESSFGHRSHDEGRGGSSPGSHH